MKGSAVALAAVGLLASALASSDSMPPSVTVIHTTEKVVRSEDINARAVTAFPPGQLGIIPPPTGSIKGSIGPYSNFLMVQDPNRFDPYRWIGPNPNWVTIATKTTTNKASSTTTAVMTKGVVATKNKKGGLDVLLSPGVKAKLQSIAKEVTPCAAKRSNRLMVRGGSACGLQDFVNRVGEDPELEGTFSRQFTDQVWDEIDEGYHSDPENDPSWEGDGGVESDDEGYFSNDGDGFYEDTASSGGDDILETIVFSSEAEAAGIAAEAAAVPAGAVFGAETVTAGSFLALIWNAVSGGKELEPVYQVPKESIHKITKTATESSASKTTASSTTTSSPTCSSTWPFPNCGSDCEPTSTKHTDAKATGQVDWVCSKGKGKGCKCNPAVKEIVDPYDLETQRRIWTAMSNVEKTPPGPQPSCDGTVSKAPSKWFSDLTKNFCPTAVNSTKGYGPIAYDVYGKEIGDASKVKRTPPENRSIFKDYKFFLQWEPKDGDCTLPEDSLCTEAYKRLVQSNCGSNSGVTNDRLFVDAKIDVGCGEYSWHVETPPKPTSTPSPSPTPTLAAEDCHASQNRHDVHDSAQDTWAQAGCKLFATGTMKPGDKAVYWSVPGIQGDWYQNFKISWIDDCTTTTDQDLTTPISGDSTDCYSLMRDNYKSCGANGGAGGSRDAGCLRYDFYVS